MPALPPLQDPHFHAGDPFPAFRRLRTEMPISWHSTPGVWALARHEDVVTVSRDAVTFCTSRGILLADTKFEFGFDPQGKLHVADEMLTPDSSRFWPKDRYQPGGSPPSLDKQFVRDYLESIGWDKKPPVPTLPETIVEGARDRYLALYRTLTGRDLR